MKSNFTKLSFSVRLLSVILAFAFGAFFAFSGFVATMPKAVLCIIVLPIFLFVVYAFKRSFLRLFLRPLQQEYAAPDDGFRLPLPGIRTVLGVFFLLLLSINTNAQVSGSVFRDFNLDGTQGTGSPNIEPGVGGVIVNAYNASNTVVASFTTAISGNYSIPSSGAAYNNVEGSNTGFVAAGDPVRIEFVIPAVGAGICELSSSFEASSSSGSVYGTDVQFVTGGATGVNFAVSNPNDFVSSTGNPMVVTTRFQQGPINGGAGFVAPDFGAIVMINNNDQVAAPASPPAGSLNGAPTVLSTVSQVGSVWGLAFQKGTGKIFSSSVVKRHNPLIEDVAVAGVPPAVNGSTGRIFVTDMNAALPNGASFIDVNTIGVNTGTIVRSDMTGTFDWFCDAQVAFQTGKVGLGDIDISEDGKYLFFINLSDRKLYRLFINNPAVTPTAANVTSMAAAATA